MKSSSIYSPITESNTGEYIIRQSSDVITSPCSVKSLNGEQSVKIPLYGDDREIVDIIKNNILRERSREAALIEVLDKQNTFLKDELLYKNGLINKLMSELTYVREHGEAQSLVKENTGVEETCTYNDNTPLEGNKSTELTDSTEREYIDIQSLVDENSEDTEDTHAHKCHTPVANKKFRTDWLQHITIDEARDDEDVFRNDDSYDEVLVEQVRHTTIDTFNDSFSDLDEVCSKASIETNDDLNVAAPDLRYVTIRKKRNLAEVNFGRNNARNSALREEDIKINRKKFDEQLENVIKYLEQKRSDIQSHGTNDQHPEMKIGEWEKHNTGFASRIMKEKWGYSGKGLGKREDGIIEPAMLSSNDLKRNEDSSNLNLNQTKRDSVDNYVKPWPKGTTLIAGDSILCGIQESRLKNAKVRVFLGACVDDMYHYLTPLLKKKPSNIILHIGSNDSPYKSSERIVKEIIKLKLNIISILPDVKLFLSCPTMRFDNINANEVLRLVESKLVSLFKDVILHNNVDRSCLGKKGLHLNPKGSGRLAINFISLMRRL